MAVNKIQIRHFSTIILLLAMAQFFQSCHNAKSKTNLKEIFTNPPESAKPWVFWYWMNATVSKEGITADLEAMKEAGIAGAYLMPIMGPKEPPYTDKPIVQLTPEWWEMVKLAFTEADRLGLKIAMHASDGFALAGGPWITPELSMQKVVWADTLVNGGSKINIQLPQPEIKENYYEDIATYAYPAPQYETASSFDIKPKVSTSLPNTDASFLTEKGNTKKFRSTDPCWIQYEFKEPFTCRSVHIVTRGNNYQSHRFTIEASEDGKTFSKITQLVPPRHGWQDTDEDVVHAIKPTTARYFRFQFNTEGSEPGAEDLDAAKWKPVLKVANIELSGKPVINQVEGKNGSVWRIGENSTASILPDNIYVDANQLINISTYVDANGQLNWDAPKGNWTILRIGHTSTGHTNYTGGGGLGLECDKFNTEAVQLQFDSWFGEAIKMAGPELAQKVLKVFHVDSWECGSQNWSKVFPEEFQKRRGYDIHKYLPVMTGLPIASAEVSERFLHDVRQTIAELVADNFYTTMAKSAHQFNCEFSAESVAPTMLSDGMLHYKNVDLPMGEFWFRSPTHDKPNDMLDAISGAHVYGKNIIQAEGFTELRMMWDEHPGNLKTLADRNYALGVNRLVYHVFTHNPWTDRKPGMTLNGVGLLFQRDQTWWKPGKAWVKYAERCQSLLQQGNPVTQVAVFTCEELPRRSILPDRLVNSLPGVFGKATVLQEQQRLANKNTPIKEEPAGVWHSANMADPKNYLDPLNGYKYDSFNYDALINLASVKDGKIALPGGACYDILVIPAKRPMNPNYAMSVEVATKLKELIKAGATIILCDLPESTPDMASLDKGNETLQQIFSDLTSGKQESITDDEGNQMTVFNYGKGKLITQAYTLSSFQPLGIEKDFMINESNHTPVTGVAWNHRKGNDYDIYFISNQKEEQRTLEVSLNTKGKLPELFNPVTGTVQTSYDWKIVDNRTICTITLAANESVFVVLQKDTKETAYTAKDDKNEVHHLDFKNWNVNFDASFGGPSDTIVFNHLYSWSDSNLDAVKYYSGTASYTSSFEWNTAVDSTMNHLLDLGNVQNIAEVYINNEPCGIAWTYPYQVNISKALKQGKNNIRIEVTNTWANRIMGDHQLPEEKRITWTNVPYRLEGHPLLKAGLLGPITIKTIE